MAEPGEAYAKILTENLQRAIDWLKFAEAKNAALLGVASAWTLAGLNIATNGKVYPQLLHGCILLALACSGWAALVAMSSFLPKLSRATFNSKKATKAHPKNLLFYGDISSVDGDKLGAALKARYRPAATEPTDEYIHDLLDQIRINSTIALDKMKRFTWGVQAMLASVFFVVFGAFVFAGQELAALW